VIRKGRASVVKINIAARLRASRQYQGLDLREARIVHAILASLFCYRPDVVDSLMRYGDLNFCHPFGSADLADF
jgi:hypothetical protein